MYNNKKWEKKITFNYFDIWLNISIDYPIIDKYLSIL